MPKVTFHCQRRSIFAQRVFESVVSKCSSGSYIVFDNSTNNIEPDPKYVELDGGPWKLCQELKQDSRLEFVSLIHRCSTFKVV